MENFSLIRHGDKLGVGETRKPVEHSGLSAEQQRKWSAICDRLGIEDPEITYESVRGIERLAAEIYGQLPERALVVFTTTDYPRTRFTAEYLLDELEELIAARQEKKIYTEVIGESSEKGGRRSVGVTDIPKETPGMIERMRAIVAEEADEDAQLGDYLASQGGGKSHARETELFFMAVNRDLGSEDSIIRKRAEELKERVDRLEREGVRAGDLPVYCFGVGHMSGLIAMDVAFNGRNHYGTLDEMPRPLALWKAKDQ